MYPKINRTPLYRVTIPEFASGVNYKDGPSLVEDNQLTDVKNMWYKNAMLRTRPGLNTDVDKYFAAVLYDNGVDISDIKADVRATDVYRMVDGVKQRLVMSFVRNEMTHPNRAVFAFVGEDGSVSKLSPLPYHNLALNGGAAVDCADLENCIAFMNGDVLWLLTQYAKESNDNKPYGFKYDFDANNWVVLSDEDFYAPTIFMNGTAQKMITGNEKYTVNGDMIEGYNLLGNTYKAYFDGYADAGNTRFVLPTTLSNCRKIVVKHTAMDKNVYTHEFAWDLGNIPLAHQKVDIDTTAGIWAYLGTTGVQGDGVRLVVANIGDDDNIAFYFIDGNNKTVNGFANEAGLDNNIEVTVYTKDLRYDVGRCTFSTWYGGNASGINGGTRLFIGGDKEHPNRILWSDLNNPLYFPENNYAYIGNDDQAITAFGKQGEMLVIFKEREIYYTYYVAGQNVEAADVINQSVIDLAANSATFPVIQIHSEIGCDCPNTVALCQNRLVWATSAGRVYTLATNNQYSERNVVEISALLGGKLRELGADALRNACAADCDEHYYLSVGKKMFVLDYGNNGLSYMASYGGYDNAVKRIAWYVWEMPYCFDMVLVCGQTLLAMANVFKQDESYKYSYVAVCRFDENLHNDTLLDCVRGNVLVSIGGEHNLRETATVASEPISCMLQTKNFDFGRPDRKKKLCQLYLSVGECKGELLLYFVGNTKELLESKIIKKTTEEIIKILPKISHTAHFMMRIESKNIFSFDGMSINYKPMGSVM